MRVTSALLHRCASRRCRVGTGTGSAPCWNQGYLATGAVMRFMICALSVRGRWQVEADVLCADGTPVGSYLLLRCGTQSAAVLMPKPTLRLVTSCFVMRRAGGVGPVAYLCAKVDADVLVRARAWCFAESYKRAEAPLARWCDRGRRSQEDPPGRHWAFTEAKVPTRVLVAEAGGLLGCRRRS